jgi:hypothetical protein
LLIAPCVERTVIRVDTWGFLIKGIMEKKIEVGKRYGSLVVIGQQISRKGQDYVFCKCDCGQVGIAVKTQHILEGIVKTCNKCSGCELRGDEPSIFKHPLHRVWCDMIARCENPKREYYYLYGGRGIKVCAEWGNATNGYINFYNWAIANGYKFEPIDPKPNAKRVRNKWALDRIDVNGDYCPENCRFADIKTQNDNRRADLIIEHNGEKAKVKNFLKRYNATVPFFYYLLRQGMKENEAVNYISNLSNATD